MLAALTSYDDALRELYRAPHDAFVAERKRLALALAQAGDKAGASVLAKHTRPSVSAWVVNQLWWQERDEFEELFASGSRLRAGQLDAGVAHRRLTSQLVSRAGKLLAEAGHSASEATLRKVSTNLAALAAKGGFEPDPPGALRSDRDPPGFEVLSDAVRSAPEGAREQALTEQESRARARALAEAEEAQRRAEAKARADAERRRLREALQGEQGRIERLEREREQQHRALAETDVSLERARAAVSTLEAELAAVTDG